MNDPVLVDPLLLVAALVAAVLGGLISFIWANHRSQHTLNQQKSMWDESQANLQEHLEQQKEQRIQLEAKLDAQNSQLDQRQNQVEQMLTDHEQLRREINQLMAANSVLKTELEAERKLSDQRAEELEKTSQKLSKDFELLANRIFEEKTQAFSQNSRASLEQTITPLREQLTDFKKKVEDVYDKESKERISLATELENLKMLNQQMSTDALNLTNALKGDNKAQGNWGEVILERILEESGLHKGREYETQVDLKATRGKSRPDVIVRLPENKDIIIDSKVSLVDYERYCSSELEEERQQYLKNHVASVRSHIKLLSEKNYEGLEGLRTLDFVFIFIPIEAAFMAAFEHDQSIYRDAYEKNIIVVGPTTLLATLRTVQSIWRYEHQNKNAEEIARQAGAMHDKFVGFVDDLQKISEHIDRASQAHSSALNKLSKGRGNLVTSTERLKKLGAKAKKSIPDAIRDEAIDVESLTTDEQTKTDQLKLIETADSDD